MRKEWDKREAQAYRKRDNYLRRTYGITTEQYEELLEKQNHSCAICEKPASEEKTRLHVDHDHVTLEVRGLLCNFCNSRFVGRHRDPERFRKAAEYLTEPFTGWFAPKRPKRRKKKSRK